MLLDHVGIAVADLQESAALFSKRYDLKQTAVERVEDQKVEVVFLIGGETKIELIAPIGEGAIKRFLDKRGPGLHHLGFRTQDILSELARLEREGATLIDRAPRPGAGGKTIAFVKPELGVLIELCQIAPAAKQP